MPITMATTEQLLDNVRGLVDFDENFKVRLEPWLLEAEAGDSQLMSMIKALRRMRHSYGSGGHRQAVAVLYGAVPSRLPGQRRGRHRRA